MTYATTYASTIGFPECGEGPPHHSDENDFGRPAEEFWPELCYNRLDESAHASWTELLSSPVSTDPAMSSTMSWPSCVDPRCFSPTTTTDTALTTADGDESGSEEKDETVWNQKRRKSSAASKTSARDARANNRHQGRSHRKSLSEPVKRERNRTAAAKCRAKSKVAEEDLKETQRIERERNLQLRAAVEELSNESLMLRHELLCHSNCDYPIINNYLSRTADQISRGYSGSSRTR
ncbi:putative E3 ubiquitin-protein ligase [Pestalotiopsis sp. IQ-011]